MKLILPYLIKGTGITRDGVGGVGGGERGERLEVFISNYFYLKVEAGWSRGWSEKKLAL